MNISVNGVARAAAPAVEPHAAPADTAAARPSASVSLVEIDEVTNLPKPPRFPWLSRLSAELEPAAKQKPAFPSAPPLGENLDRAA